MEPAISVVIACRNAAETLGVQLEALCRQQVSVPFDVLVCDNGSTDDTVALARSYTDHLDLRMVDASGRAGAGYARNVGAQATAAPMLAFCDADDEVADGWLEAIVAGLREHPFVAGRFDGVRLNDPRTVRTRPLQQSTELQHSPFGPGLPHAGAGNMGILRSAFLTVGGFDPNVGCLEDTDLSWRVQQSGVPLVFWPDAVLHVRLRSSLSGMWKQGLAYGEASALLSARYGDVPAADATAPAPAGLAGKVQGLALKVVRLVAAQRSVGGFLWTLGWHVGHRRRPVVPALPVPLAAGETARRAG